MEAFILVVCLIASAGGALILLSNLAGHRATLLKAFELEEQTAKKEQSLEKTKQDSTNEQNTGALPVVTGDG